MDEEQPQHFRRIDAEIASIDQRVAELLQRKRDLVRMKSRVWVERCLRPDDHVSEKNAKKFELLGYVYSALATLEPNAREKGLTSQELFRRCEHHDVKYETFRSYLHRFKKEERLAYDQHRNSWKLAHKIEAEPKTN